MTIDEAIKHAEEVAEEQTKLYSLCPAEYGCNGIADCRALKDGKDKGCLKCAEEYKQLAEWLKELKELRSEPCKDCISREAAVKCCWKPIVKPNGEIFDALKMAIQSEIEALHSVEPEPRTGHWIKIKPYPLQMHDYECSECLHETDDNTEDYCSACGAKMVEPQEIEDNG